jgi:hypothetical protein
VNGLVELSVFPLVYSLSSARPDDVNRRNRKGKEKNSRKKKRKRGNNANWKNKKREKRRPRLRRKDWKKVLDVF